VASQPPAERTDPQQAVWGKPPRRARLWPRLCTTLALRGWGCGVCEGLWMA
jgi:hypothetical protein